MAQKMNSFPAIGERKAVPMTLRLQVGELRALVS